MMIALKAIGGTVLFLIGLVIVGHFVVNVYLLIESFFQGEGWQVLIRFAVFWVEAIILNLIRMALFDRYVFRG